MSWRARRATDVPACIRRRWHPLRQQQRATWAPPKPSYRGENIGLVIVLLLALYLFGWIFSH